MLCKIIEFVINIPKQLPTFILHELQQQLSFPQTWLGPILSTPSSRLYPYLNYVHLYFKLSRWKWSPLSNRGSKLMTPVRATTDLAGTCITMKLDSFHITHLQCRQEVKKSPVQVKVWATQTVPYKFNHAKVKKDLKKIFLHMFSWTPLLVMGPLDGAARPPNIFPRTAPVVL